MGERDCDALPVGRDRPVATLLAMTAYLCDPASTSPATMRTWPSGVSSSSAPSSSMPANVPVRNRSPSRTLSVLPIGCARASHAMRIGAKPSCCQMSNQFATAASSLSRAPSTVARPPEPTMVETLYETPLGACSTSRPMPTISASPACSTRMPAILPSFTSTSFGHFSVARTWRGNSASTASATASAARKPISTRARHRHIRSQHHRQVEIAWRAEPAPRQPPSPRRLFIRMHDRAVWRTLRGKALGLVIGGADAVVVPDVECDHGSASRSFCARARFSALASRATMRCSTERARGSPASPSSKPNASRLSNHSGSNGFRVNGRRRQ